MKPALLLATFALGLVGCSTTSSSTAAKPTQYPCTVNDYNGIDSVEFIQAWNVGDYTRLVVEPFQTSNVKMPARSDNTYEAVVAVLEKTDGLLLGEISRRVRPTLEVMGGKFEAVDKTLALRGKVDDMNPGSRAARYWGGFGAGAARVTISGEIVDTKTGAVVTRFRQCRIGMVGAFGGGYNAMLTSCVTAIGGDIGTLIASSK